MVLKPADGKPATHANGGTISFEAPSRAAVAAFHRAALAAGGKDEGAVGPRGFWRATRGSREGISGAFGLSLAVGRGPRREAREQPLQPSNITGNAKDIVQTALGVLGTPYEWGGTAENGFDCSGLIQYAYARHGIRLPRTSHDQAHAGSLVTPIIEALQPGDILLFSAQPGSGVTHVGMYVGEHTFIHSSNAGVGLSRLEAQDSDGAWWVERWVGARRVVQ